MKRGILIATLVAAVSACDDSTAPTAPDHARHQAAPAAVPNGSGAAGALLVAADAQTRAFRGAILESGPAHYWSLDETEGPAVDAAGDNDMSIVGDGVTPGEPGLFAATGTSYLFNELEGIPNGLLGSAPLYPGGLRTLTYEAVLRWDGPSGGIEGLFTRSRYAAVHQNRPGDPNGTGVRIGLADLHTGPAFEIVLAPSAHSGSSLAQALSPHTVEVGRAYHVVGTYDGATGALTLYVDGVEVANDVADVGSLNESDLPGRIGWELSGGTGFGTRSWHGVIDEVAVYHRLLTPEEIAAHAALLFARVVQIDIRPESDANPIRLGSRGTVPVAVLGEADFDATMVDPLSIELAGAPVRIHHGEPRAAAEDVNNDGFMDLVVHVETAELELSPEDTEATLTGRTFDDVPIIGTDAVRIVP